MSQNIYCATYSNVPVYEFNIDGHHVMRRRQDNWINATQILKVAAYDKPSRTRILEKEVHRSQHEKIQGGYGKYQGTWVPLPTGRELAECNNVLHKLRPLFDYIPGDISPPPAPKHTTAASNKPKIPKPPAAKRIKKSKPARPLNQKNVDQLNSSSLQFNDDESLENSTIASGSFLEDDEGYQRLPQPRGSLKRKRAAESKIDNDHQMYADGLLDYFIVCGGDLPASDLIPPALPANFQVDRPIDNQHHTALHWAAAMGDLEMVKTFLDLGANLRARNVRGETPIIRAVIFTNNYEKDTMPRMVKLFQNTLQDRDNFGGTIFHHAAALTFSHIKKQGARYYLDILLNTFSDITSQHDFFNFMNAKDHNGDTALHIVARNNAKKCVRALLGRGVASDIANKQDETADKILHRAHDRRSQRVELTSSSPAQPEPQLLSNGDVHVEVSESQGFSKSQHYEAQAAQSFSSSFQAILPDKGLQFALAIEKSVHEKDADLEEANRLLQHNIVEREQVRGQILVSSERSQTERNGLDADHDLIDEEARLRTNNESLLEQRQHMSLHQEVRAEEQNLPPSAHQDRTKSNGETVELERKLQATQVLAGCQSQRRLDVIELVQAQARAGMSDKGESYKRLIANSIGVNAGEVPNMVLELLDVLETSKMDAIMV